MISLEINPHYQTNQINQQNETDQVFNLAGRVYDPFNKL